MAAFYSYKDKLYTNNAISWSDDNRIALCTDSSIKCLNVTCNITNSEEKIHCQQTLIPIINDILDLPEFTEEQHRMFLANLPRDDVQTLVLDRTLNPYKHMQEILPRCGFCIATWSPKGGDVIGRCIIATASHDHRICIHSQKHTQFEWFQIADFSTLEPAEKMPKLKVYDSAEFHRYKVWCHLQVPTAMCWLDHLVTDGSDDNKQYGVLAVGTKSGHIVIWKIAMPCVSESDCSIVDTVNCSNATPVSCLKPKPNTDQLVVGFNNGEVHLLSIDIQKSADDITPHKMILHDDQDELRITDVTFVTNATSNQSALLVSKCQCVMMFVLEDTGQNSLPRVVSQTYVVGDNQLAASGLFSLDGKSALMASIDMVLQKLTVNWDQPTIDCSIETLDVKLRDEIGFHCYGITCSPNSMLTAYVLRPIPGYDHLAVQGKRDYTTIYIQCLDMLNDGTDYFQRARNILCNPEETMEIKLDVLEVYRQSLYRENTPLVDEILASTDSSFRMNQLKRIALLIQHNCLKDKIKSQRWSSDVDLEREVVLAKDLRATSNLVLKQHALASLTKYTESQDDSRCTSADNAVLGCMCRFVETKGAEDNTQSSIPSGYRHVKNKIQKSRDIDIDAFHSKCCICSDNLTVENLIWKCSKGHCFDVCSKTLLPCEGMDYRTCLTCRSHTVSIDKLQEISWLSDPYHCTLCHGLLMPS